MNFEDLKELCFEYLKDVAIKRAKDVRGCGFRDDKWNDSVIYEAFMPSGFPFDGGFGTWLSLTDNSLSAQLLYRYRIHKRIP